MRFIFMIRFSSILLVILLIPFNAISAPAITTATTSSISGSAFGTNSLSIQDTHANIDAGTNGGVFTKTGWGLYVNTESSTEAVPRYSTDYAHSGTKSIKIDYIHDGIYNRYKGHFYYDYGSLVSRVYMTFWVRAQRMQTDGDYATGQWKIWRLKENTGFTDGSIDFMQNSFHENLGGGNRIAALYTVRYQSAWDCNGCANEPSTAAVYLAATEVPGPNAVMYRWVRMEYWMDVGTLDAYDGTFVYKFHDPENPITPVILDVDKLTFENNLNILKTGTNEDWRAFLFGGAAVDGLDFLVYFDDVFIQIGSWARVEIGNASTWANCTHREVQLPTAWSSTSISYTLNQGSLPDGTAYVYVVDDSGATSSGYAITLGGAKTRGCSFSGGSLK